MRRALLVPVFVLGLGGSAQAAILAPIDPARLLPPPPAEGSIVLKDELSELNRIAAESSAEQVAAAARDALDQNPDLFNSVLGFDIMNFPKTVALLQTVADENRNWTRAAKDFFHRPRPWVVDPGIKSCVSHLVRASDHDSYPSGHTSFAYSTGVTLAALLPEKPSVILARSAEYARNRMVCGYHYRSDTAGGQVLGTMAATELMRNDALKRDFEAAAAELKARPR